MKYLKYLWNLLRHKWFTFIECCKLGIPWLGIIHDWSKFLPSELIPYTNHFYGRWDGASTSAFDTAWLHHQKRNRHHWQYWMLTNDDFLKGEVNIVKPVYMPRKYEKEMLADWRAASRAYTGGDNTLDWYMERRERFGWVLYPATVLWIEEQLGI